MSRSYFTHFAETIKANDKLLVNCQGRFVCIKESTDTFYIQLDGGEKFPAEVGLDFALEQIFDANGKEIEPDFFRKLVLSNDTNTDIDVEFYVGRGKISDYRLNALVTRQLTINVGEAPTFTKGGGNAALAPAAAETYDGLGGGGMQRKHIVFANADTDITLDAYDENGAHCGYVFPQETLPLATSGKITIKNNGAANVAYSALELYYVAIPL